MCALMTPEVELLDTEEKYVNSLKYIIASYLEPMEKWIEELKVNFDQNFSERSTLKTVIKSEKINIITVIFSNMRQILTCNEVIYGELKAAMGDRAEIVKNFSRVAPSLKFYADYIRNCENARTLLKRLEQDHRYI